MRVNVGGRHLTPTGLPVSVVKIDASSLTLQSLISDNRILVPADYPLFRYREPVFKIRAMPYSRRLERAARGVPCPPKPLAPVIDALLLKGGLTMQGLAREAKRRASAACRGKDVCANVRARLYWFKRKGYMVKKRNDLGHIKVFLPKKASN
jgi:hypothetical protein